MSTISLVMGTTGELGASLLSGQLRFILEKCRPSPDSIETELKEINAFIDLGKQLKASWSQRARPFSQTQLGKLARRLSELRVKNQNKEAEQVLKTALNSHHIPNDL